MKPEGRELIAYLATHVMGWPVVTLWDENRKEGIFPRLIENVQHDWVLNTSLLSYRIWDPLDSHSDCFEMEEALSPIQRPIYLGYLQCQCVSRKFDEINHLHLWALVHATTEQRCLAAYQVTKEAVSV